MSKMEKPDPVRDVRIIKAEISEWEIHLNQVTGLLGFTFSVAALGAPLPQLWGFISLIFLITFHISMSRGKMTRLRELDAKKNRTEYDEYVRRDIRKNLKFYKVPAFLFGITLLFVVSFAPNLFPGKENFLKGLYGDKPYATAMETMEFLYSKAFE